MKPAPTILEDVSATIIEAIAGSKSDDDAFDRLALICLLCEREGKPVANLVRVLIPFARQGLAYGHYLGKHKPDA